MRVPCLSFLDYLNPLNYFSEGEYASFWQRLFETVLSGFWGRFFALALIVLGFYFVIRRQRYQLGIWCIVFATLIVYGGTLLRALGLM
jgi:hypothetical protein